VLCCHHAITVARREKLKKALTRSCGCEYWWELEETKEKAAGSEFLKLVLQVGKGKFRAVGWV
jgi:hypothetical protein